MKKEEIKNLTSAERVAGYLARMAAVAYIGARLRTKYANDEDWSLAEEEEWFRVVDDADPWFQSLKADELEVVRKFDTDVLAPLCRGEWPLPSCTPDIIKRECKSCGKLDFLIENKCSECK